MDVRWTRLAALAAEQHGAFCVTDAMRLRVSATMRCDARRSGLVVPIGPRTCRFAATPCTWDLHVMAALLDAGPDSFVAGRSGAVLHRLDGFRHGPAEVLVPRRLRDRRVAGVIASTSRPIPATDVCRINGMRTLRVERLILEALLFHFSKEEMENAIDSAMRLRLITEQRLRDRVEEERSLGTNGSRILVDALLDAGGHSGLERAFLRLLRLAGIRRPTLQVRHRDGSRTIARVDAQFGDDLVVEVAGHETHSTRRQRQVDAQRHTELTLRGKRVLTFTWDDVVGRPEWVGARIREALAPSVVTVTIEADSDPC